MRGFYRCVVGNWVVGGIDEGRRDILKLCSCNCGLPILHNNCQLNLVLQLDHSRHLRGAPHKRKETNVSLTVCLTVDGIREKEREEKRGQIVASRSTVPPIEEKTKNKKYARPDHSQPPEGARPAVTAGLLQPWCARIYQPTEPH